MNNSDTPGNNSAANLESARGITLIVYILQALLIPTGGLTALIAVIINYVKLEDVAGTWLASHFRWQIRTFWFGLLWSVLGGIFGAIFVLTIILIPLAWAIWVAIVVWIIYRIVKGLLRFLDGKPMYAQPVS
jgi:uncharacterized membrane protein